MMLKASWPPPGSGSRTFGVFASGSSRVCLQITKPKDNLIKEW